jgi:hypothetical protein
MLTFVSIDFNSANMSSIHRMMESQTAKYVIDLFVIYENLIAKLARLVHNSHPNKHLYLGIHT